MFYSLVFQLHDYESGDIWSQCMSGVYICIPSVWTEGQVNITCRRCRALAFGERPQLISQLACTVI